MHILSPFDPLVIQRRLLAAFFGHAHRFEAYVPAAKRTYGYFALPVLLGDAIIAVLDLKADRATRHAARAAAPASTPAAPPRSEPTGG